MAYLGVAAQRPSASRCGGAEAKRISVWRRRCRRSSGVVVPSRGGVGKWAFVVWAAGRDAGAPVGWSFHLAVVLGGGRLWFGRPAGKTPTSQHHREIEEPPRFTPMPAEAPSCIAPEGLRNLAQGADRNRAEGGFDRNPGSPPAPNKEPPKGVAQESQHKAAHIQSEAHKTFWRSSESGTLDRASRETPPQKKSPVGAAQSPRHGDRPLHQSA